MSLRSLLGRAVLGVLLALAAATPAAAAVGDPSLVACLNGGTALGTCSRLDELTAARPELLSPDGKQLYVATSGGTPSGGGTPQSAAVLIFDRAAGGDLTYRGSATTSNMNNPQDIAISPDGTSLYVSNAGSRAIADFARGSDGSLSPKSDAITTAAGWGAPHGMALTSDGKLLYVSTDAGTLLVFARDGTTGNLTQLASGKGCYSAASGVSGCTQVRGIPNRSWEIALSPDGKNLYVTGFEDSYHYYGPDTYCSRWSADMTTCYRYEYEPHPVPASGGIATFGVAGDGSLTQAATGCTTSNGADGGNPGTSSSTASGSVPTFDCTNANDQALVGSRVVTVSPDGRSVYVGSDTAIISYSRAADGSLTRTGCVEQVGAAIAGCTEAAGVGTIFWLRITPDGSDLIASSRDQNALTFFKRAANGTLSQRPGTAGCMSQTGSGGACQTLPSLGSYGSVVVSPDSLEAYVTGQQPGSLATLHRDAAPVCTDVTTTVTENQPMPVSLSCSDPNGDQIGSIAAVRTPFNGALGAVDLAGGRVTYSPFTNYLGVDSFTFAATAHGVTGAPATASLDVVAPPPASPPGSSPTPPPSPVTATASTPGSANVSRPVVSPSGVTATISCAAGGATCSGTALVTTTEHMAGTKITALSARARLKRLTVGKGAFRAAAGSKANVVVKLSSTGRKLLAKYGKLPATLRVTLALPGGKTRTIATQKLTFRAPKKKR